MSKLITIAVPTFNNAATIATTLDSCLNQACTEGIDYEVLVVNNASTDGTADILADYLAQGKVRVVTNATTCSLFENHNVCLREAEGKYVLFCHSDDTLDSRAVSILARKLEQRGYPDRYVVWGYSLFRDFSPALQGSGIATGRLFAGIVAVRPFLNRGLTPSGTCYSRDFIVFGGFHSTRIRIAPSDASSMVWLALNGFRFEMMEEIIFSRQEASTAVRSITTNQKLEALDDAYKTLMDQVSKMTLKDILQQTQMMSKPPIRFYYVAAKRNPKAVRKSLAFWVVRRPKVLVSSMFWKVLIRSVRG